ncbi:4746_t:CDS:2 [Funneliformis mosseae]|uniref:4746_t:CDS:1 n=1 Tax=Funneliformis mosseae TaxID=27381 RepID=A0A9N9CEA2_FUNMO|nr:4746_t:CDS:2 [Funneliformis mosseae]
MRLLDFLPEYVVSSLSAIAIMGDSPYGLDEKIMWFFRCFGCPFDGLFHSLNVGGKKESCCFWLSRSYFLEEGTDAKLPVLERVSLLITSYYIIVGVIEGFSMMKGTIVCKDWAYLPLLFSWTLLSIWKRGIYGIQVVKDPKDFFKNIEIVENNLKDKLLLRAKVTITALFSIVYPWVTVLIVYLTPPVGYYCRSKYVTIICSIWSFNSVLAICCHIIGESDLIMSKESEPKKSVSEESDLEKTESVSEESDPEKTESVSGESDPEKTLIGSEVSDPEKTVIWKCIRKFVVEWQIFVEKWKKFVEKLKRMRTLHIWNSMCGLIVTILVLFLGIFTGYNTLWVDLFGDACDLSSIGCY